MKKIITGFLGILMVTAVVGGSAYALFSSTATVSGIAINTGSASLLVGDNSTMTDDWDLSGFSVDNIYPGFQDDDYFYLENASTSPIDLTVTGQFTSYSGNWNALKDVIQIRVVRTDNSAATSWRTLADWQAGPVTIPGGEIAYGDTEQYQVMMRVPSSAGNEIANKSLSNMTFTFVGTQAP